MIKNLFLLALVCIAINAPAQKVANPVAFAKTITPAELKKHLTIIASAEMEGRDTPSPGLEKAAKYIETQFKKFGVKPANNGSYRQQYILEKDSTSLAKFSINNNQFEAYKDFAPWLSMPQKASLKFSEYTFVGYGIVDENTDDYKNADVKGKLVVFLSGQPDGYKTSKPRRQSPAFTANKIENAKKKGAAAVLIISDVLPPATMGKGTYRPAPAAAVQEANAAIPAFFIGESIVTKVGGHDIKTIKSAVGNTITEPAVSKADIAFEYASGNVRATVSNVLGMVEGTDKKDEYLFVTAHYDHVGIDEQGRIYYGADDDGSGTAGVIKMAEAFAMAKKAGKGPRRTVVFMLVSGEEKGLWGSEYYSENPVFSLAKTTADLNIDMIGRVDTERMSADTLNYIYVIGHNKLSTDLPTINEGANNKYTKLVLDYKYDDPADPNRIYYRSDHYNFARKGVPVLFFYDGMLKADYHKPTDTVDKINFTLMAKRAQMIFYTAWEMANRNTMLTRNLKLED